MGSAVSKAVRWCVALLMIGSGFSCGDGSKMYLVKSGSHAVQMSVAAIRDGVKNGTITEKTPVYIDGRWILFKDNPETARFIEEARADDVPAADTVEEVLVVNADSPGDTIDIKPYIVNGKINIFDFYSEYCGPCVKIAPRLKELAHRRPDIVVRKVDINRPDHKGIDWMSPVARQYDLRSIPHFKIFGPDGELLSEGRSASKQVNAWIKQLEI